MILPSSAIELLITLTLILISVTSDINTPAPLFVTPVTDSIIEVPDIGSTVARIMLDEVPARLLVVLISTIPFISF